MRDHTSHSRIFLHQLPRYCEFYLLGWISIVWRLMLSAWDSKTKNTILTFWVPMVQWEPVHVNKHLQYRVRSAASVGRKECPGTAGETICFLEEKLKGWERHPGRGSSLYIGLEDSWPVPKRGEEEHENVIWVWQGKAKSWRNPKAMSKELKLCYIWVILNLTWDANDSTIYGYCFYGKIKYSDAHIHTHFIFYIQFRDLHAPIPRYQTHSPAPKRSRDQWKILGWAGMCSSNAWPYNHWKGSTEKGWKKYRLKKTELQWWPVAKIHTRKFHSVLIHL